MSSRQRASYEKALPYNIDLVIPGYERSYPKGTFRTLALSPGDSASWYREFTGTLEGAIGKRFLPVCRLGDMEYMFLLGGSIPALRGFEETAPAYVFRRMRDAVARVRHHDKFYGDFRNMEDTSIPSGVYTKDEWRSSREKCAGMLRGISRCGIICPWLSYRKNSFHRQYFIPFIKWIGRNDIKLTKENYYPCYFVYALLNGPERGRILGRKKILVVTHHDDEKAGRIRAGLAREGAEDVQFVRISKDRSMFDVLDLSKVRLPVDVVLVGAGIGKINILTQLEATTTLCVDAGFVIECIAYPEFRRKSAGTRSFCWPDCERNGDYTPV